MQFFNNNKRNTFCKQHLSWKLEKEKLCDLTLAGVDNKINMASKCLWLHSATYQTRIKKSYKMLQLIVIFLTANADRRP